MLYEARANTGIERMKIINSVAKSVPAPHKVDLSNPDKTIIVEIVKVCVYLHGYLHEMLYFFSSYHHVCIHFGCKGIF